MKDVVPDNAAGRYPQAIDQTGVTEDTLAEIMDVVELDHVVARSIGLQAPVPADADPRVVKS